MPERFTCPRGHQWDSSAGDLSQPGVPTVCPVCGLEAQTLLVTSPIAPTHVGERSAPADYPPTLTLTGAPPSAEAGELPSLDGYEVLGVLGRGGVGVVYKARQKSLNRLVAIKMILAGTHATAEELTRFRAEAAAVARLQHPNIVQIYEVGEQDGRLFLSLEFVDGASLAQRYAGTPAPPRTAAQIVETLARTMHHAHQRGIVHRDLKPGNVLLTRDGVPKITDFGLAKEVEADSGLTRSGVILGTPSYMAPEQATGETKAIGPLTDVYALGAILYELLAGRPPFREPTPLETVVKVAHSEVIPPRRLQPKLPRDLETICLKALAKEPHKRYPSAESLADDLHRFLSDQPIKARRIGPLGRAWRWARRHPAEAVMLASIATLLVVLAAGSFVAAVRFNDQRNEVSRNLSRALAAEGDAKEKLWQSYRDQARAGRWSGQAGRRFASLEALAHAAELRFHLDLRNEAVACLALADMWPARSWPGAPPGTIQVAFSNGLDYYARRHADGTISVRRTADDVEVLRCTIENDEGDGLMLFSPDGRHFAALRFVSGRLTVWRLSDGECVYQSPSAIVGNAVTFSPDGKTLAVGWPTAVVSLFDLETRQEITRWSAGGPTDFLAYHPEGRLLAVSLRQQTVVEIRDVHSGQLLRTLAHPRLVRGVAWRPDGGQLAVACADFRVHVWDAQSHQLHALLEGHQAEPVYLTYNHRGDLLASTGWDGTARLWDPLLGKALVSAPSRGGPLCFSRDDRFLSLNNTDGGQVGVWEVTTAPELRVLAGHLHAGKGPWSVEISPDGRLLASGSGDGVRLWDLRDGRELAYLPTGTTGQFDRMNSSRAVFDPHSGDLLTAGRAGLHRWPVAWDEGAGGTVLRVGPPHTLLTGGAFGPLALSADGKRLAVAEPFEMRVTVLDLDRPARSSRTFTLKTRLSDLTLSPDGKWIATSSWQVANPLKVWDADTAQLVRDLPGSTAALRFTPDGQWLVAGSGDAYRFWETGTWAPARRDLARSVGSLPGPLACTCDGRVLAIAPTPRTIQLRDIATGDEIATLPAPYPQMLTCLTFSPDGSILAAATEGQTIQVWNLRLIRRQLAAMRLDWDLPGYPEPKTRAAGPVQAQVELGELARALPVGPLPDKSAAVTVRRQSAARRPATPAEIAQWVTALASADPQERDAAALALEEAGPPALPALAKAAQEDDPEVRRQADAIRERIKVFEALAPSLVTLRLQDAPITQAVDLLARQTHFRLELNAKPSPAGPRLVTLELEDVPFWQALDRLCEAAGLTYSFRPPQTLSLSEGQLGPRSLRAYPGCFQVVLTGATTVRRVQFQGTSKPPIRQLVLSFASMGESPPGVLGVGLPRLTEVVDDRGQPWRVLDRSVPPVVPFPPPWVEMRPLSTALAFPPQPGKVLRHVKGVLPVDVRIDQRVLVAVDHPTKAEAKPMAGEDGIQLTIHSTQRNGRSVSIRFTLTNLPAPYDPARYSWELTDDRGRPYRFLPTHFGPVKDRLDGTLSFSADGELGPPAKLTFFTYRRVRTELPFEFRDVPLP